MIVYKYLRPDRTDVLERCAMRFTQPAAFNDPFESLPCFSAYGDRMRKDLRHTSETRFGSELTSAVAPVMEKMIDSFLATMPKMLSEHFVILSLSRIRDNLLMWAHYANSHRGFVIGFDSESQYFNPANDRAVDGLRSVEYSNERAVLPELGVAMSDATAMQAANEYFFFTKSSDWAYEREVRILAQPQAADITIPVEDGYDIHLFEFPHDAVTEVILGAQMSVITRTKITDMVRKSFPSAALLQARLNDRRFAVDVHHI